jgi:exodeoxyribonuclease VII small subunit
MAEKKNLNAKIAELNEKVEWFYSDEFELSEAVERYEEATKLAKEINADLDKLKNEIKVLAKDFSKEF